MKALFFFGLILTFTSCNTSDEKSEIIEINHESDILAGPTGCEEVLDCFNACGDNSSCVERCINSAESSEEASKAVGVAICLDVTREGCFTDDCRLEKCSNYIDICLNETRYSCGQVIDCQERCLDSDCEARCIDLASGKAREFIDEILVCFGECSDDVECIDRRCWDEISTCREN